MCMATKTITITEEAYELLAAQKTSEESFSEAIRKHFKKESLANIIGILTHAEASELRKHVALRRTASRHRVDRVASKL